MYSQLTQRQSALEQQTHAINQKMDLLLIHMGKHEIGEYVDEIVRTHVGSPHIRGSSPSESTNGLHDNLGKMNLGSNSIAQPHTRLPATGDLQFNLGDRFQPANVNFPSFKYKDKNIILRSAKPKGWNSKCDISKLLEQKIHILKCKKFEREGMGTSMCLALVAKEVPSDSSIVDVPLPPHMRVSKPI